MTTITIPRQFRGPPFTANGGYICGVLSNAVGGRGTAMLRSGVPLDTEVTLTFADDGSAALTNAEGTLLGAAKPADDASIPPPIAPPSVADARRFGDGGVFAKRPLHRGCFSCCIERDAGEGLGVFVGPIAGAPEGRCAGVWTPHANFAGEDGLIPDEITWGALDCPGSMAWFEKGTPVGLLGTMSGEVLEKPRAGETYVVTAWTLASEGRKHYAGVALHDANGKLMARGGQIWIARAPAAAAARVDTQGVTA